MISTTVPSDLIMCVLDAADHYKRTGAMLDRLLHRSVVLNIAGGSYRMRAYRARAERLRGGRSEDTRR